jgi:hypothetical protein
VTLVTEGNLFLETGLALLPNLEVTTVGTGDWETGALEGRTGDGSAVENQPPNPSALRRSTLTIFDAYVPLTATLPSGNLFFIAPPRSTDVYSVTGQVEQPVLRAVGGSGAEGERDPLLAHVEVTGVGVQQAMHVSLPTWARPVIAGDVEAPSGALRSVPLLWAGEHQGRRVAVLAFDLRRSDLALHVAFPLLLANLTSWLAPSGGSDLPAQATPGELVTFALPPSVQEVRITRPDGVQARTGVRGGQATFADTELTGVYRVRWGEEGRGAFAVNLFAPLESDLAPAGSLPLIEGEAGQGDSDPGRGARREWWRLLATTALLILVAEWLVYHRATVAQLWARGRDLLTNSATRR